MSDDREIKQADISSAVAGFLLLNDAALDAAKTATIPTRGFSKLTLFYKYTRSAGTAVTTTMTESLSSEGDATNYKLTTVTVAGSTGTRSAYTDSFTTSVSANWSASFDVSGDNCIVTIAATSGGVNDKMSLRARLSNA